MTRLLTLTGPSGVGKTTIANALMEMHPNIFSGAVAFTTRAKREGEVDGVDYIFLNKKEVENMIEEGLVVQYSIIHGNYYGHTINEYKRIDEEGRIALAVVDLDGVNNFKKKSQEYKFKIYALLLLPTSFLSLGRQLSCREGFSFKAPEVRSRWREGWDTYVTKGRKQQVYDGEEVNHYGDISFVVDQIVERAGNFFVK